MTKPHDHQIIHSSEESDWRTPPACAIALEREFGFQLDAAANAQSSVCAENFFGPGSTLAENALLTPWDYWGDGTRVFLNPPYSRQKAAALRKAGDPLHARSYEIGEWAAKAWHESQRGVTVVAILPFAPQTEWYRQYVYGHQDAAGFPRIDQHRRYHMWSGHAAKEERRIPHRISFLRPDGTDAANAGVNSVVVVWTPMRGAVGPWMPHSYYWSYR